MLMISVISYFGTHLFSIEPPRVKKPAVSSKTTSDNDDKSKEKPTTTDGAPTTEDEAPKAEGDPTDAEEIKSADVTDAPETIPEDITEIAAPEPAVSDESKPITEDEEHTDEPVLAAQTEEAAKDETTAETTDKVEETTPAPVVKRVIYELLPDYVLIGQLPADQLVAGPVRPATRQECEVVLMIGLPSGGKTTWALNYAKENEEKNYYVLSQHNVLAKTMVNYLEFRLNCKCILTIGSDFSIKASPVFRYTPRTGSIISSIFCVLWNV